MPQVCRVRREMAFSPASSNSNIQPCLFAIRSTRARPRPKPPVCIVFLMLPFSEPWPKAGL